MFVFHSALRFMCMYVFVSFSLWVCTDIYSNISANSLLHFPLIHSSVSFPLHHFKPSNLSLSKYRGLQWQVEWGKRGNIYMYSCVHVSHIECETSQKLTFALNIWQDDQMLWTWHKGDKSQHVIYNNITCTIEPHSSKQNKSSLSPRYNNDRQRVNWLALKGPN